MEHCGNCVVECNIGKEGGRLEERIERRGKQRGKEGRNMYIVVCVSVKQSMQLLACWACVIIYVIT